MNWETLQYYLSMGIDPAQAMQASGAPQSAMARMQGADGGYQAPGLLDTVFPAGDDEKTKKKKTQAASDYGMDMMKQAAGDVPQAPPPQAEAYRPNYNNGYREFRPIKLQGLL